MCENAELLCRPGEERRVLTCWLRNHSIPYRDDMTTDELTQLYRDVECGVYGIRTSTYSGALSHKLNLGNADTLFNKLRYKKDKDDTYEIIYKKNLLGRTHIIKFMKKDMLVITELVLADSIIETMPLSMELLKAINSKCIELGWL